MDIRELLGDEADSLLGHEAKAFPADGLVLPGPDFIDRVFSRVRPAARRSCGTWPRSTTTAGWGGPGTSRSSPSTRGSSIRPRASFAKNPAYFDPANLCELALEPGSAAPSPPPSAASGSWPARYAHKIPFIVKLNHNDFLHYPNTYDQVMFGSVRQAIDLGAVGVGATIYYGSEQCDRQIHEVSDGVRRGPPQSGCSPCCGATCATRPSRPGRRRLPPVGRSDRPGQPHGRDHRGRHHQAEAAREQRWLQRPQVRQDRPARLRPADHRPPDRPHPLAGRQLLRRPDRPHQLRAGSPRATTTWPRRCAPPSSTSGPAGQG